MKLKWEQVMQSLLVASFLAIAGAAIQTYIEVRQLRKDVDRLEGYIVNLIEETVK